MRSIGPMEALLVIMAVFVLLFGGKKDPGSGERPR